jgi:predicted nicotinamide N-methyase
VVLAGDVCYEEEMAATVLPWLTEAHRAGIRVLLGDPGRHYFPREIMSLLATYDVPTTWEVEGAELKRTGVYTFA